MKLSAISLLVLFGCATAALAQTTAWTVRHDDWPRGRLYTVDLTSGALSPVGTATFQYQFGDLTYDWSTGKLYAVSGFDFSTAFYEIDPSTGVATLIGSTGVDSLNALTYDPVTGNLYAWCPTGGSPKFGLFTIDRTAGAAAPVGISLNARIYGLTVNQKTNDLVGLDEAGNFFAIDRTTGTLHPIGSNGYGYVGYMDVAHVPSQNAYFTINQFGLLGRNDDRTFDWTLVAFGLGPMDGLAVVPEPASLIAVSLGTLALAARRRRR